MDLLEAELRKLDKLVAKQAEFPATIAGIDTKLKELEAQDLSTLEALESRQAQQGKLSNMRVLADDQAKKTKAAIAAQQEVVLKIGTQATSLTEQLWWSLHAAAATQAEREFHRLFYHAYEWGNVLSSYKPLTLLERLRPADVFRTGAIDVKLTRCRQLRTVVDRLQEFSRMTFQEISDELEALDRESRERRYPLGSPGGP